MFLKRLQPGSSLNLANIRSRNEKRWRTTSNRFARTDEGMRLLEIAEVLGRAPSELKTLTEYDWMFLNDALSERARRMK
jgi:uncharacterized protein (DUF2384 family)